jgi:hypothetical protein
MSASPGRSYRYYDGSLGPALVDFGTGMSYSTFSVACTCTHGCRDGAGQAIQLRCSVSNVAGPDGDEVLMVYHRPSGEVVGRVAGAHPLPLKSLVAFDRVSVAAGATASVSFLLDPRDVLPFVDATGSSVLYQGAHFLDVSNGNGVNETFMVVWPGAEREDGNGVDSGVLVVRQPPVPVGRRQVSERRRTAGEPTSS